MAPGEELGYVIGPGGIAGQKGERYLIITSQRIVYMLRSGFTGSFKMEPLLPMHGVQALSIVPSWEHGSDRPRVGIGIKFNALPAFAFIWPRPNEPDSFCEIGGGNPPRLVLVYAISTWHRIIRWAESARGTWRAGGYPDALASSILLEPGELPVDCLFGASATPEAGFQFGGLLLTNARCLFVRRGSFSNLAPYRSGWAPRAQVGRQFVDNAGYATIKSQPLDTLTNATVGFDGAIPMLSLDGGTFYLDLGDDQARLARFRGFVDQLRLERNKFAAITSPVARPPTRTDGGVRCWHCGTPCDASDAFCAGCGAALRA